MTIKKENRKNMDDELTIKVPEDCVIDKERTNLDAGIIVYKKKSPTPWKYKGQEICGYHVRGDKVQSQSKYSACPGNFDVFAKRAQARASLAASQISQYMANDPRYGGVVTDEEWKDDNTTKYVICRYNGDVEFDQTYLYHSFLAFHTKEQRSLFYEEHKDLILDFLMLT